MGAEEEGELELRLNNHIRDTDRRFTDHEGMFRETNGTVAAQRKLIDATREQVNAQMEGTEVLREVAILLKDFTEAMRPIIKGLAWIGRIVKYCAAVVAGAYACWIVIKYAVIGVLKWMHVL